MIGRKNKQQKNTQTNFLSVCFFVACFFISVPSNAHAEYIDSFNADIAISKDSSFTAAETINYVFTENKHGVYRCIPTLHAEQPQSLFKERFIDIALESVKLDGGDVPYTVTETGDTWCLKVGDPDQEITGAHSYEIVYRVHGAISYEENGGAELYWNVTGNEWEVPMRLVVVSVTSPDDVLLRERACYKGIVGESGSCAMSVTEKGDPIFQGNILAPHEGVTIAQAVNRSVVARDIRERYNATILWIGGIILSVFISGISLYRYKTKFDPHQAIIPQYEPYPEVKPMYAGYLFDKRLDPRDITAGIVYLAEQGFIKIRKTEKKVLFFFEVDDYEITLLREFEEAKGLFEQVLLELIFNGAVAVGKTVSLSDLKNNYLQNQHNYQRLLALTQVLREDVKEKGFIAGLIFTRRTRKGYEALNHLKGFKDFLSVTESQRYIFHNAPEINAEHFMQFLPYAIAFGVEKQWAKTFEKITIPNPDWYDGGGSIGTFNTVALTQSLGAFSTAFTASTASGSASSGGGHSGGGSGGGGGGSW